MSLKQQIPRAEKQSCLTCLGKKFTGKKAHGKGSQGIAQHASRF